MGELTAMGDSELLEKYRGLVEFRTQERQHGQITPHILNEITAVEEEILVRMSQESSKQDLEQ